MKLLISWLIYAPTLTFSHELWVVTDYRYKQQKSAFSEEWLACSLEIEFCHSKGAQSTDASPPYQKETTKVVWEAGWLPGYVWMNKKKIKIKIKHA